MNKLSVDVGSDNICLKYNYLKIAFKFVQMKFLAMHITNTIYVLLYLW